MDTIDREHLRRIMAQYGLIEFGKAVAQLATEHVDAHGAKAQTDLPDNKCSFCGKGRSEVGDKIIAGPNVFICIKCVDLCYTVRQREWPDTP
jgi:hypothetical protein